MNEPMGTFYGIGVGPGDPDLMTVKAVKTMNSADVVIAASNERNEGSLALSIARPHLKPGAEVVELAFPHTFKSVDGRSPHAAAAKEIALILKSGRSAAFLTLGDPMTYSTFSYVLKELKALLNEVETVVVPGVTSFAAAAAATLTPLAEGDETLTIVGASRTTEGLSQALTHSDNLVIMKPYRNAEAVLDLLDEKGLGEETWFCAEVSRPTALTVKTTAKARANLGRYMSLLLVRNKRTRQG